MLNELSSIARDLLGLHGYPARTVAPPAAPQPHDREGESQSPACRDGCRIAAEAKTFPGASGMGHVHW